MGCHAWLIMWFLFLGIILKAHIVRERRRERKREGRRKRRKGGG